MTKETVPAVSLSIDQDKVAPNMPGSSDPAVAAEADRLADIRDDVELSIGDLPVSRVTIQNMDLIKQRMSETHSKAKEYALGMTKMGRRFPDLEESFKLQYAADGRSLLKTVSESKSTRMPCWESFATESECNPRKHVPCTNVSKAG